MYIICYFSLLILEHVSLVQLQDRTKHESHSLQYIPFYQIYQIYHTTFQGCFVSVAMCSHFHKSYNALSTMIILGACGVNFSGVILNRRWWIRKKNNNPQCGNTGERILSNEPMEAQVCHFQPKP